MKPSVIVIGAGAAGLAAAEGLKKARLPFVVLEARDRVGGRAWTRRAGGYPIELGAEFVHGRPEATLRRLRRAGQPWVPQSAGFSPQEDGDDFWSVIESVLGRLPAKGKDEPLDKALSRLRIPPDNAAAVLGFVQSFHAADTRRVSARDLAEQQQGEDRENQRLPRGYGALFEAMARRLPPGSLKLSTVVRSIRWSRGRVEVLALRQGRTLRLQGEAALITLPVGVLKSKAVRFTPALPARTRDALRKIESGATVKVGLLFKAGYWKTLRPRLRAPFLRAERGPFAVFWTMAPLDIPMVTGWLGGPPAVALSRRGEKAAVSQAVSGLAAALQLDPAELRRGLAEAFFHDWLKDPCSRGSYSYLLCGSAGARAALAEPVARTLLFAGEATVSGAHTATVAGALESGERAARELASALEERERPKS